MPFTPSWRTPWQFFPAKLLKRLGRHGLWREQIRLLKLSAEAKRRLEWFIFYEQQAKNVSLTCRHFHIAPKTFYKWQKRFVETNLRTLEDHSKAPQKTRQPMITPLQEQRIVALRKQHIRWGKMKLCTIYQEAYGEPVSSWKIQYTVKKYRLYYNPAKTEKLAKARQRNQAKKRITELHRQPFPGFLIALDAIVKYGYGFKRYILTAIDAASKIAFARMYTAKSSRNAADFLKRIVYLLDDSVLNAQHDNGSEFHKEFIEACQKLKINQYWSRIRTPQDNAINERFNRTLQEEFIALGHFSPNPEIFNRDLTDWLVEYNFKRPHQTLGYQTPWAYYQKAAKVLPMSTSRTDT